MQRMGNFLISIICRLFITVYVCSFWYWAYHMPQVQSLFFSRDLTQIINIVLQVGVWLTPIMWIVEASPLMGHPVIMKILKLNPMYYIVSGYRDTFLMKTWFWEHAGWTVYFWIFTILCFLFGSWVFKRLRIHFADVL